MDFETWSVDAAVIKCNAAYEAFHANRIEVRHIGGVGERYALFDGDTPIDNAWIMRVPHEQADLGYRWVAILPITLKADTQAEAVEIAARFASHALVVAQYIRGVLDAEAAVPPAPEPEKKSRTRKPIGDKA